jgi:hypothetical protein
MGWQRSSHSPVAMDWTRCVCGMYILELTSVSPSQDGDWVEYMARAVNAIQMHDEEPVAVALELPEELRHMSERPRPSAVALEAREQFVREIRNHISHNRAVVVKGCCFSQCRGFSVEDIGMVRPSMFHSVYWHGTCTIVYICLSSRFTYNELVFKMPWSEQRIFLGRNNRILSSSWTCPNSY